MLNVPFCTKSDCLLHDHTLSYPCPVRMHCHSYLLFNGYDATRYDSKSFITFNDLRSLEDSDVSS